MTTYRPSTLALKYFWPIFLFASVCREFVGKNLSDIQRNLLTSLSKASPPSQASRLRCLIHIVRQLQVNFNSFRLHKLARTAFNVKILCLKATGINWWTLKKEIGLKAKSMSLWYLTYFSFFRMTIRNLYTASSLRPFCASRPVMRRPGLRRTPS